MKTLGFVSVGIVSGSLLLGCGGSAVVESVDDAITAVASVAAFNDDDVMFAQMMIPHHEQAIEMSDIALDPSVGSSETVRRFATQIRAAQDPEVAVMTEFLRSWDKGLTVDESIDHSDMMTGMLTLDEMSQLGSLRSSAFDRAWIEGMIKHHEGALDMANDVLSKGENLAVRTLAKAIIEAQNQEISAMKELLSK
jgi:uncharacterized protein (DUF305 family)